MVGGNVGFFVRVVGVEVISPVKTLHVERLTASRRWRTRTRSTSCSRRVVVLAQSGSRRSDGHGGEIRRASSGTLSLILMNLKRFGLDHWVQWEPMKKLALVHGKPKWWQFVTSLFCHASWSHLSGNLFFLLVFGRFVEDEEGGLFTWMSFLVCGVVANVVSFFLLPGNAVSMGASGAVFGLLTVSLAVRARGWSLGRLLESVILGQFVWERVMEEARMATGKSVGSAVAKLRVPWSSSSRPVTIVQINHVAHVAGAAAGVLTAYLLRRLFSSKSK